MASSGAGSKPTAKHPGKTSRIRVIGGAWRRSILPVLELPGLRPTPDRVRETTFNWILHCRGGSLSGANVLDLFCGSGALGIEAASRGAASVVLVDTHPAIVASLRTTLARLGAQQVSVVPGEADALLRGYARANQRFSLIFLDPPFGAGWIDRILAPVAAVAEPGGLVYVECERALLSEETAGAGFECIRADKAGQVFYHLLRRNIDAPVD